MPLPPLPLLLLLLLLLLLSGGRRIGGGGGLRLKKGKERVGSQGDVEEETGWLEDLLSWGMERLR